MTQRDNVCRADGDEQTPPEEKGSSINLILIWSELNLTNFIHAIWVQLSKFLLFCKHFMLHWHTRKQTEKTNKNRIAAEILEQACSPHKNWLSQFHSSLNLHGSKAKAKKNTIKWRKRKSFSEINFHERRKVFEAENWKIWFVLCFKHFSARGLIIRSS